MMNELNSARETIKLLCEEKARLRAVNALLLEACKKSFALVQKLQIEDWTQPEEWDQTADQLRAAISAATEGA